MLRRLRSLTWIFGYGSLIWRPTFPFVERRAGYIEGWARRFWQGSTDHRGVPGAPGRVVTLVPEAGARCHGVGYAIAPSDLEGVLAHLDHREKGGYERLDVSLYLDGVAAPVPALLYVATERNAEYLGPAPLDALAAQIRVAHGPSGTNVEYVMRLAESLRALGADDPHVFDLAAAL
jgi:cation transport regulator ChaC